MNMIKTALMGCAAFGLIVAGTAEAASTLSSASIPARVQIKKTRISRTAAPKGKESAIGGESVIIGIVAAVVAGVAGYYITRDNGTTEFVPDSPGA
jgi:hypothetical protein